MLPKAERVDIKVNNYKKIWVYAPPFAGKTTFADTAPTPLNLNTDGNVKYVTMARLPIKDEVTVEGRMTKRKFAWEILKEAISDLEKGSDFETVVIDLLEDTYEYCRLYMYDQLGITHESDDSFRAWDKVRTEYLSTIKRLLNLPYNIILLSHEDATKDITKKTGDKITSIKPNINEKVANKVAGMVDIVARIVVEDDNTRYLSLKNNEVVFGGGRLQGIKTDKCNLTWDDLCKVYEEAIGNKITATTVKAVEPKKVVDEEVEKILNEKTQFEVEQEQTTNIVEEPQTTVEEQPVVRRKRRVRE